MSLTLTVVVVLTGVIFYREGKITADAELRDRALSTARVLAATIGEDIASEDTAGIRGKIAPLLAELQEEAKNGKALTSLLVFNSKCELMLGGASTDVFFSSEAELTAMVAGKIRGEDIFMGCVPTATLDPVFAARKNEIHDLTLPVSVEGRRVGYVRVGMSGEHYAKVFSRAMKGMAVALIGIFLIGMAFSQIIAAGITRPVHRLSEAAEKLSRQNWDAPIPIKGSDELSRLGHAFNRMALTLKQRETRLSRGNRDLFILHTAGLDLMECLDRDVLLTKIAARVEDLVRADTTAVSVVDQELKKLKYLRVSGGKAKTLKEQDLPIEAGGIYNWLVSYGTPLLIPNAQDDFRLDGYRMQALGIRSLMTVPLWSSNVMIALLTVVNKKGSASFDKHDLRLLTVFSNMASAALQNALLYGDLKANMRELKDAQEQLIHSTKMAAIGELAANVAHEINNPLTSVLGYATHLQKTMDLSDAQRKILRTIEQETLRVRKIIRNLLDFARQRPSTMFPADILTPLKETISLIQGLADEASVTVLENYPSDPIVVNMDQNEIKQVFINITNNALQVMPNGGVLRVSADVLPSDEVAVVFSDTGRGISAEHLQRIFEPFFSTKENGNGTGLGLSISYRIVHLHGGRIEAENGAEGGAVFRVTLPLYREARLAPNVNE
jgi:signal transduction histidine kinase/HAMP domain-containing protein